MPDRNGKTALVLAGGGIMGAAYEIGCLTALDRLFSPGFSTTEFDTYIGVSAGSVIATLIANRISPGLLFSDITHDKRTVYNWGRKDIYRLDALGIVGSFWQVLRNLFGIYRNYRRNRWSFNLHELFYILQEQFPAGLFSLGPMQDFLCQAFAKEGIINDFHLLERELYIPAYDLDRGERVVFGEEGFRDIPICKAITASCAVPYFFRPHRVDGRYYIDGSIGRLSHLDLAIARGARLVVLINPRVPMDNDMERFCLPSLSYGKCSSIANLGITFAWEQSQRIDSREKLSLALDTPRRARCSCSTPPSSPRSTRLWAVPAARRSPPRAARTPPVPPPLRRGRRPRPARPANTCRWPRTPPAATTPRSTSFSSSPEGRSRSSSFRVR